MNIRNIRLLAIVTLAFAGVSCKPDRIEEKAVSVTGVAVSPVTAVAAGNASITVTTRDGGYG